MATGRTPPADGAPGFAAEASVWKVCIKNRDLLSANAAAAAAALAKSEGCSPIEDSLCKDHILTLAQIARAAHLLACFLLIAVFVFAILDRCSVLGGVPGNPDTHSGRRLVSWTVSRRRRVYIAAGILTSVLVMAGAIPSTRFLYQDCLGHQVSVDPGLIIQWIATLFGIVVAIVAGYHTDTPDYVAINKVLEDQKNRVQQRQSSHQGAVDMDRGLYADVGRHGNHNTNSNGCATETNTNNGGRCVSSFVPEEELQRVRAQSVRQAAAAGPPAAAATYRQPRADVSPAERSE